MSEYSQGRSAVQSKIEALEDSSETLEGQSEDPPNRFVTKMVSIAETIHQGVEEAAERVRENWTVSTAEVAHRVEKAAEHIRENMPEHLPPNSPAAVNEPIDLDDISPGSIQVFGPAVEEITTAAGEWHPISNPPSQAGFYLVLLNDGHDSAHDFKFDGGDCEVLGYDPEFGFTDPNNLVDCYSGDRPRDRLFVTHWAHINPPSDW